MKTEIATFKVNLDKNYQIDYRDIAGNQFVVAPVSMMAEGVHSGSAGPILHTSEGLESSAGEWEGIPTIPYHPHDGEKFVGVKDLSSSIDDINGRVYNTYFDSEDNALKGEVWLSVSHMEEKTPELYEALKEGEKINVSIGVASEEKEESGEWNGEAYNSITETYYPDHLAILLDSDGACSLNDGCGIRAYEADEEKSIILEMYRGENKREIIVNKEYREFIRLIDSMVPGAYENAYTWVMEVYDDFYIYEVDPHNEDPRKYYKQYYSYSESEDEVTLMGDPVEVVKNISFDVKVNSEIKEVKKQKSKQEIINHEGGKTMGCNCDATKESKIESLIKANKGFTDKDKEMLEGLDEKVIDYMITQDEAEAALKTDVTDKVEDVKSQTQTDAPANTESEVKVNEEDVLNALSSIDKNKIYNAVFTDQDRKVINRGLQAYNKTKEVLVEQLKDKVSKVYSEEDLEKMELDELEKTAKLVGLEDSSGIEAYFGLSGPQTKVTVNSEGEDLGSPLFLTSDKMIEEDK